MEGIVDASDREEGGNVVVWWNDLEKDQRYAHWSNNMQIVGVQEGQNPFMNSRERPQLLRPIHPREFHSIKRNLFNIIMVLDLTDTNILGFVSSTLMSLIERGYPFRFGLVPIIETEDSLKIARLFYWLNDTYGTQMTMQFFRRVSFRAATLLVIGELSHGSRCSTRMPSSPLSTGVSSSRNSHSSSWKRSRWR